MRKPGVLDLLKAALWADNERLHQELPDEVYKVIRDYVAKVTHSDRGRTYVLGKPLYEALEFVKEPESGASRKPMLENKGTA